MILILNFERVRLGFDGEERTMSEQGCHRVTLARNEVAHVERCTSCGCLTVSMGPLSVRIDERSLGSLVGVLGESMARLADQHGWRTHAPARGLA